MATDNALTTVSENKLRAVMRSPDVLARFAEVLGQHNAAAYVTSVLLAVANNEKLQECSHASVISSSMRAATLRLSCDPATKQAHLVPYKGKATLQVGYKGYYDMAMRTGRYRYMNDFKVYEGQEVKEDQLTGKIEIVGHKQSDTVIGYGFYFEMLTGFKKVFYMTVEEILAHGEKYSPSFSYSTSLWKTNFEAMARKTVIKLCLSRYGYLDPNDQLTLSAVDDTETDDDAIEYQVPEPARIPHRQAMADLGFEPDPLMGDDPHDDDADSLGPITGEFHEEAPATADVPALRYQPETLKARLQELAKTGNVPTGQIAGVIPGVIEAALSHTTSPADSRKQLMVFLIGKDSFRKFTPSEQFAFLKWLEPRKLDSGEWVASEMAAREILAAFNAAQPKQEAML